MRKSIDKIVYHLVGEIVEKVICSHSSRAALFVAEDEVDPEVQVGTYPVRLQRLDVFANKVPRTAGPRRQQHVVYSLASGLSKPQIQLPWVAKKLTLENS